MKTRHLALGLASAASLVGIVIAATAAMDRGGSALDRTLMVGVSVVLVLCAHLLPSITATWASRVLWLGCLLAAAWGHATFFTSAAQRAGGVRSDAVAVSARSHALQLELDAIQARPLAQVSAEAAVAAGRAAGAEAGRARCERAPPGVCGQSTASAKTAQARVGALADELGQARRGAELRGLLADEAGRHDSARAGAAADPVAAALAALTGTTASVWSTGSAVMSAVLVELVAVVLWSVALKKGPPLPTPATRPRRKYVVVEEPVLLPMRVVNLLSAPAISVARRISSYRSQDSPGGPLRQRP